MARCTTSRNPPCSPSPAGSRASLRSSRLVVDNTNIENELLSHDFQPRQNFPHERPQVHGRSRTVEPPPPWIPDSMAPQCMGCGQVQSFFNLSFMKSFGHCVSPQSESCRHSVQSRGATTAGPVAASSVPSAPPTRWRGSSNWTFFLEISHFLISANDLPNQRVHRFLCQDMECRRRFGFATDAISTTCKFRSSTYLVKYIEFTGSTQYWSLFVKTLRTDIKTFSGTLMRRGQHMHTMCTAAPATAAGDTRGWSPKKESWSCSPRKSSTTETTYSL